jgi:hypothetical protein
LSQGALSNAGGLLASAVDAVGGFFGNVVEGARFRVDAVSTGIRDDFAAGALEGIIGVTGGRSGESFGSQLWESYSRTSVVVGPISSLDRRLVGLLVAGGIGRHTGYFLSPFQWARSGFAPAPWLPTRFATLQHVSAGVVVRGLLIGVAYEVGNFGGAFVRVGTNRLAIYIADDS